MILILVATSFVVPVFPQTADTKAKVVSAPKFVLSPEAERAGIDGAVTVALTVDKTGVVKNVRILGGPLWPCNAEPKKELEQVRDAVEANVLSATFSPAMKDGKAVSSDLTLTFLIGNAYRSAVKQRAAEEAVQKGLAAPRLVDQGEIRGRALRLPKPEYPSYLRAQRAGGPIPVLVMVDEQGNVVSAGAVSGHPALQASARDSACSAKFSPTVFKGQPVKVTGVVTYTFAP